MIRKSRVRYLNFNIIQLVDKGKLKLYYRDNIKLSNRIYSTRKQRTKSLKYNR